MPASNTSIFASPLAEHAEPLAESGDTLIVSVEKPSLGQQRMHERIANGAFRDFAEFGARHQNGVYVNAVRGEAQAILIGLLIVDRHEHQVDIGLQPDCIVRQATAKDCGQNGAIPFYVLNELVESGVELVLDLSGCGGGLWRPRHATDCRNYIARFASVLGRAIPLSQFFRATLKSMRTQHRAWLAVGPLVVLCGVLAILQYRWIGEISGAERQRLQEDLRQRLDALRRNFNNSISSAAADLQPPRASLETVGAQNAYELQYRHWEQAHEAIFRRIALVVPHDDESLE